ncbi:MAG TPA: hypothetical protein VD735_05550, partial [Candidatus Saccharimonadales bacterium]|nr:hypothetical protein [Candidatus Saccharimonadales bacterium]
NDRLVVNQQVQVGVTVDQVKAYVDAAIAQNSWLVLTFHDIVNTAAEATAGDDYYYLTSQLDEIAAYVKSKNVAVVSPHDAIVNNDVNLLGDGSFDGALSTDRTQTNVWSTDDTTGVLVKKDGATNGSLVIGNTTSPLNSIFMSAAVNNSHLFSPRVAVTAGTTYTVKAFVNVTAMTGGEVAIYVDEYDAAGTYLKTTYQSAVRYSANANAVRVANTNFAYTPSAGATTAQVYVAVQGGFGIQAYIDNVQMFAPGVVTVPPTGKTGDITGDGIVNDDDATILFANWGSTPAAGDIDKNGVVNDDDATLLFANWSK